ncbi:hypothetical protein B0T25DRAFT_210058 [Lasiosphaeria hispida]|uniref:Uncharacterized protein n=1 Tax=Lasiosphaeria hispida TaxID=260671 RepID=A0AAJ0HJ95_9PEZI|nr:hypothetical protein B0T25DRAFT_210058 [Lasiosphaeria hispida]
MTTFTITASPGTDLWRKPPHADIFNAPTAAPSSGALPAFLSARGSFAFDFTERYDQVGLLLTFHPLSSTGPDPSASAPKWIKTGIEFYNSKPMLSTVACERYADWSVSPLGPQAARWTTISIEKSTDEHGTSLWVYHVLEDGTKVPLREIAWVFGDNPEGWKVEASALAARPEKGATGDLVVEVKDFEVKWEA